MTLPAVCITGIGAVTPIGNTYAQIADNMLSGASGIRRVTKFPIDDHPSQIASVIDHISCPAAWSADDFASLSPVDQATTSCCIDALLDSGWWERRSEARIGIVLGNAGEWSTCWEIDRLAGGDAVYRVQGHVETLTQRTRRRLGLSGPAVSLSAACASGNYAIALARRWLQMNWVDVCLAGACDMAVTPLTLAGFGNMRALSRRNDEPAKASRPFDMDRDGFVMGEGGAMFVMERADSARKRSARAYAEVAGCGASSDAYHMVIPSPHLEPAISAMRQAISDAGIDPSEVDYVNAHATSTPVGDQAEAKILNTVFGSHIEDLPVSSTKSMTGHLLTAAASVEALACIISIDRQKVPPTINLDKPDPECRLRHVANHAESHRVRVTASNSFGFGGSNTCLILRAA
ncbi:MAG: beta-ketoacyl-[acyl-carrier-protein] synthase family protein [Planctomycetes bacterium]|nr:beta-ketoacyl-[acyl-carrier-protein] synthase family protein [Planctomycetota bacterium]